MEVSFVRGKLEAREKVVVEEKLLLQCLQLETRFAEEMSGLQRDDIIPGVCARGAVVAASGRVDVCIIALCTHPGDCSSWEEGGQLGGADAG